jgi:hypothetical protein
MRLRNLDVFTYSVSPSGVELARDLSVALPVCLLGGYQPGDFVINALKTPATLGSA